MAARAMWKGVLALPGLRLPVKLYAAVEDRSVHFHLLHAPDRQRVQQKMVDPESGETVAADAVRKGLETAPGVFVVLDSEELAGLEPEPSRDVELVQFLPAGTIDQAYYQRPYWLGPDGDEEAYFALVAALEAAEREGVARWVMRKRPYSGALRPRDGYLSLIALRHAGEVVLASEVQAPGGRDLDAREARLAGQLVDALADAFDPTAWHDTYRERVAELVAAKAAGRTVKAKRVRARRETDSLEKALAASLAKAKKGGAAAKREPKASGEAAAKTAARRPKAAGSRQAKAKTKTTKSKSKSKSKSKARS